MADVFISYSRADSAFVHRIHDALQADGRDVWVDFEDIPPSAEWMSEIHSAIEAAQAFVYVISPHSAASTICGDELAHALAHNKRIIPMLRGEVDQTLLAKAVCERNWVFCRDDDDFDAAIAALNSALDTDLDWVRGHTRLLTRAVEWNGRGRDKSFALRGNDLHEAERCLTVNDKEPRLTPLQVEYVLGSRREENNRRNRAIGATGVAVTVLMVIATLLVFKYNEAQHNLARDFREKGTAALANADPVEAELYFARSLGLDDTDEARQLLLQARARSARLLSVTPGPAGSEVIAASADGALFARRANDTVTLWNRRDGREAARLTCDAAQEIGRLPCGDSKLAAAFSPDGRRFAVADDRMIAVFALDEGARLKTLAVLNAPGITGLVLASGGDLLVSGGNDGTLALWDLASASPEPTFHLRGHRAQISSLAMSADGRFLASGSWDNDIKLWSVAAGAAGPELTALATLIGHDDAVLSLAFSPDGTLLASGGWDNRILLWDRDSGRLLRDLVGHGGGILALAFSAQGDMLASGSEDHTGRVWQVQSGRPLLQLPGPRGNVTAVAFAGSQAPHQLALGDQAGAIRLWDLEAIGQRDELLTLLGHQRPVKSLAFNPKGSQLASGSWDRTVRLWDLGTGTAQLLRTDADPGATDSITMVNFNVDGTRLVSASKDGTVRLWDLATPSARILAPQTKGDLPLVRDAAFSADGKLIATASDDGRIRIWNAADGSLVKEFAVEPGTRSPKKVLSVAFSPDGRLLASAGEANVVRLWRTSDWSAEGTLSGHSKEIWQVVFTHGGSLLMSASDDQTARIWDVAAHRQVAALKHTGPVWGVDIAGDGHTVATASSDGSVHLWTLEGEGASVTTKHQAVLRLSDEPVWVIAFNRQADNPLLAIGGVDRAIRIVRVGRLRGLFADRKALEQEATDRSGLMIEDKADYPLVPVTSGR